MAALNSLKPQCPNKALPKLNYDLENNPNRLYSDSSSWDSDPPSSASCDNESLTDDPAQPHLQSQSDFQTLYNSCKQAKLALKSSFRKGDAIKCDAENPTHLDCHDGIGPETFVPRKPAKEGSTGNGSRSCSCTDTDSLSDYSESDLRDLLSNKREGEENSAESNPDFDGFDQAHNFSNNDVEFCTKKQGNDSSTSCSCSSSSIDGDEIKSCLADPDLGDILHPEEKSENDGKENDNDGKNSNQRKDAETKLTRRGNVKKIKTSRSRGIDEEERNHSDSESSSSSSSETEQERWERIVKTVKRMKMLLIKYPKFANRAGNNNIVSALHSMMDTLESKADQTISSMDLKMVEEQMEAFKTTLLSGIDEDLAKWRTKRKNSKHNLTRIFCVVTLFAALASCFATFIYDFE